MEKDYDASLTRCSWDGDSAGWTDFVRRVRLLYEKTPRKKRRQFGPSIVAQLRDRAWTITQDVNHQKLTRRDGSVYLLEFLRDRLGRSPIPDVGIRLEELMIRLRRSPGTAMSSWASQVRQTYKRVQVALHRARKEHGLPVSQEPQVREAVPPRQPSAPSSPSNASRRDRGSPTRRSSETTQEPTAEEEGQPEEDAFDAEYDETEFELRDAGPKRSWQKGRKKKPDDDDDDSDDSAQMMKDLEVWDRYEEGLEEVLPGEVLGWLLLRRANLPTSARLSIQAAAGNSLLFTDVERAMRSMEDELMVHDEAKRNHQPRRRSFWVEEEGEWSLVMAPEEDLQELVSSSEVHYVGSRLPPEVYYHHEPEPASYHGETGFWHQDDDGAFSFWEMAEDGEFYTQDTTGLYGPGMIGRISVVAPRRLLPMPRATLKMPFPSKIPSLATSLKRDKQSKPETSVGVFILSILGVKGSLVSKVRAKVKGKESRPFLVLLQLPSWQRPPTSLLSLEIHPSQAASCVDRRNTRGGRVPRGPLLARAPPKARAPATSWLRVSSWSPPTPRARSSNPTRASPRSATGTSMRSLTQGPQATCVWIFGGVDFKTLHTW